MFYFPLINGTFPEWFPIWGGEDFQFFRPIFNFADASITAGIVTIILFHKKFAPKPVSHTNTATEPVTSTETNAEIDPTNLNKEQA